MTVTNFKVFKMWRFTQKVIIEYSKFDNKGMGHQERAGKEEIRGIKENFLGEEISELNITWRVGLWKLGSEGGGAFQRNGDKIEPNQTRHSKAIKFARTEGVRQDEGR